MTRMLEKLSLSGSLQVAMLLIVADVVILVLEQCGYGPASKEFISASLTTVGWILGKRSQTDK